MPDILTTEEREAIEAFDGPVTTCPPRTFTEDTPAVSWRQSMDSFFTRETRKKAGRTRRNQTRERYVALIEAKKTKEEIAEALGITVDGVRKAMRRYRLNMSGRQSPGANDVQVREMAVAGETLVAIGKATGMAPTSVGRAIERLDLTETWRTEWNKRRMRKV